MVEGVCVGLRVGVGGLGFLMVGCSEGVLVGDVLDFGLGDCCWG